ncbi:MAG: BolA family transcriptional regulator [Alphaproteobacteria bacterium]|nr:BolA family transcriptional regulator [Alphaproteobacteria bacterium]
MTRQTRIYDTLTQAFTPEMLEVIDDSARHAGHAGASPEGETHYNIVIKAAAFDGLSRVAMQRAIMQALEAEFQSGLHALSIKASTN